MGERRRRAVAAVSSRGRVEALLVCMGWDVTIWPSVSVFVAAHLIPGRDEALWRSGKSHHKHAALMGVSQMTQSLYPLFILYLSPISNLKEELYPKPTITATNLSSLEANATKSEMSRGQ